MAKLIISRSSEYANLLRNIKVYVDGEYVDRVKHGETKTFEVQAGQHTVQAKIDWCGSSTYTFKVGEHDTVTYNLTSFKGNKLVFGVALVAIVFLAYFKEDQSMNLYRYFFMTLLTVAWLILFYFYTLGRSKYLDLQLLK